MKQEAGHVMFEPEENGPPYEHAYKSISDLKKETYHIRVYLDLPKAKETSQLYLDKEVPGTMKAEELLLNCISYFNKLLREGNHGVQLKDNDKLYRLHIAKKSGKPKDDLPPIDRTQAVMEINFSKFAMSCPDQAVIVSQSLATAPSSEKLEERKVEANQPKEEPKREKMAEEKQCCNLL